MSKFRRALKTVANVLTTVTTGAKIVIEVEKIVHNIPDYSDVTLPMTLDHHITTIGDDCSSYMKMVGDTSQNIDE